MENQITTSSGTDLEQLRAEFEVAVLAHFGKGETFERDKDGCYINRSWHDAFIGFQLARRASPQPVAVDEQVPSDGLSPVYGWLQRAARSGIAEVEDSAYIMMAYYQGAEFPEPESAAPSAQIAGAQTITIDGRTYTADEIKGRILQQDADIAHLTKMVEKAGVAQIADDHAGDEPAKARTVTNPDGSKSTYVSEYEAGLENDLAAIRDMFPTPEAGDLHNLWSEACSEPRAVLAYVKAQIATQPPSVPVQEQSDKVDKQVELATSAIVRDVSNLDYTGEFDEEAMLAVTVDDLFLICARNITIFAQQSCPPVQAGAARAVDFDKLAILMAWFCDGKLPTDLYWKVDVTSEVLRRAVAVVRSAHPAQDGEDAPTIPTWQERMLIDHPDLKNNLDGQIAWEVGNPYKDAEIADLRAELASRGAAQGRTTSKESGDVR